jgi:hypothetical protein
MLTFDGISCFISPMASAPKELLGDLLKATSRSFYLMLRVLPAAGARKSALFPRLFSCRKRLIFSHDVSAHRLH